MQGALVSSAPEEDSDLKNSNAMVEGEGIH